MMNKVLVLMSCYNGAKFVAEQIDSILKQENVMVDLLIRDDGSTDDTIAILGKYTERYSNIRFILGNNVGVVASFNELLVDEACSQYDYFAFSDQDDVWMPNKLYVSTEALKNYRGVPTLWCSNPQLVDEKLNPMGKMRSVIPDITPGSAIIENIATGCTTVFNSSARKVYLNGLQSRIEMHDYWLYLCCVYLGHVIYDDNSYVWYRQHESNQVGASRKSVILYFKHLIERSMHKRKFMLQDFQQCYESQLDQSANELLNVVCNYQQNIIARFKCVFKTEITSSNLALTWAYRIRVLLGKL